MVLEKKPNPWPTVICMLATAIAAGNVSASLARSLNWPMLGVSCALFGLSLVVTRRYERDRLRYNEKANECEQYRALVGQIVEYLDSKKVALGEPYRLETEAGAMRLHKLGSLSRWRYQLDETSHDEPIVEYCFPRSKRAARLEVEVYDYSRGYYLLELEALEELAKRLGLSVLEY